MASNDSVTDTQLVRIVEEFGDLESTGPDPFEKFLNGSIEWDDSVVYREVTTSSPKNENDTSVIIISDDEESPDKYQKRILLNRREDLQTQKQRYEKEKCEINLKLEKIEKELNQIMTLLDTQ